MRTFFFPTLGQTVQAESRQEALEKVQKPKKEEKLTKKSSPAK